MNLPFLHPSSFFSPPPPPNHPSSFLRKTDLFFFAYFFSSSISLRISLLSRFLVEVRPIGYRIPTCLPPSRALSSSFPIFCIWSLTIATPLDRPFFQMVTIVLLLVPHPPLLFSSVTDSLGPPWRCSIFTLTLPLCHPPYQFSAWYICALLPCFRCPKLKPRYCFRSRLMCGSPIFFRLSSLPPCS